MAKTILQLVDPWLLNSIQEILAKCGKYRALQVSVKKNQTPWTIHEKKLSWLSDFFYGYFIKKQFFCHFSIFQKNSFVLLSRLLANHCWIYKNDKRNQFLWSILKKIQTPRTVQFFLDIFFSWNFTDTSKVFGTKFLGYHFMDTAWIVGPLG